MIRDPNPEDVALMADLKKALRKHPTVSGQARLAIAAQLVGNLIAMQDQTKRTPEQIMEMVAENIQIGNRAMVETWLGETKGSA